MCNIRRFYRLRELYEAGFHKLGVYGSGQLWTNAWEMFRLTPSRGGRRLLWLSWCDLGGADVFVFFFRIYFSSTVHGLLQV